MDGIVHGQSSTRRLDRGNHTNVGTSALLGMGVGSLGLTEKFFSYCLHSVFLCPACFAAGPVLLKLDSVLSSVTPRGIALKPLFAFGNFWFSLLNTPIIATQYHETKYLKPRSFLLKTPNLSGHLVLYSIPRIS
jgi:hypothetical protein